MYNVVEYYIAKHVDVTMAGARHMNNDDDMVAVVVVAVAHDIVGGYS